MSKPNEELIQRLRKERKARDPEVIRAFLKKEQLELLEPPEDEAAPTRRRVPRPKGWRRRD